MRQCENIFVFIDLTKSIGSDLGGQCPPRPPPNSAYASTDTRSQSNRAPLGCGGTGDLHHRCAADRSAETA